MNKRILVVDDETNLLQSLKRSLRGRYDLTLAVGGQEAIDQIRSHEAFAVIICDMQMPDITGLDVLRHAREIAPDSVRMMLTGNVDQQTAVDAVNSGSVFRFLNKPCATDAMCLAIDEGIRQFHLVTAEKELLSQTVRGAISLVTEMMSLANPEIVDRRSQTSHLARRIAQSLGWEDAWQYEVAAMLSQVGTVGDPMVPGKNDLRENAAAHAQTSSRLVSQIPRLEPVAKIILHQFDDELPEETSEAVRQGSRLLRVLCDFEVLRDNHSVVAAINELQAKSIYDERMLAALSTILLDEMQVMSVAVEELTVGMVLEDDLMTKGNVTLLRKGSEITSCLLERISAIQEKSGGIQEPINVRVDTALKSGLVKNQ